MEKERNDPKKILERLAILEVMMENTREELRNIRVNHLERIYRKLEEIEKQLYKRPNWFITGLVSLVVGLVVFLLTK